MSNDHAQHWADELISSYKGVSTTFGFWDKLTDALSNYVSAANDVTKKPVLTIQIQESKVIVNGPIVELRLVPDSISRSVFYGFTSPALADLAGIAEQGGCLGKVEVDQSGYVARLICSPKIFLDHGSPISLDEIPDGWKRNWPLSDILARYFIESVLDADKFIAQVLDNAPNKAA